jgi:hypothetical protein
MLDALLSRQLERASLGTAGWFDRSLVGLSRSRACINRYDVSLVLNLLTTDPGHVSEFLFGSVYQGSN